MSMRYRLANIFRISAIAAICLLIPWSAVPAWSGGPSTQPLFGEAGGVAHPSKYVSPPSVAMDKKGAVFMAWSQGDEDGNNIYVSFSSDAKSFNAPVAVNSADNRPGDHHSSPSLVETDGTLYVGWSAPRTGAQFAADLLVSRSTDGGKTFSPAVKVNDSSQPASASYESMGVAPDGSLYIVWLDGRDRATGGSSTYFAVSRDGGRSFSKNLKVDGGSCPCCRTALAVGKDGAIFVVWRKVYEKNTREMVMATSHDAGASFGKPAVVGNDQWVINGCPHRGAGIGIDRAGAAHVIWYSEGAGHPAIYYGVSKDGVIFTKKEITVTTGFFPDHPALIVSGSTVYLAWEEMTPVFGNIMFKTAGDDAPQQLSEGPRRSAYPALAVNGDGKVAVSWTKDEMRNARSQARLAR